MKSSWMLVECSFVAARAISLRPHDHATWGLLLSLSLLDTPRHPSHECGAGPGAIERHSRVCGCCGMKRSRECWARTRTILRISGARRASRHLWIDTLPSVHAYGPLSCILRSFSGHVYECTRRGKYTVSYTRACHF
jgi:hypothetical protein